MSIAVVFDFDCTLTISHLFFLLHRPEYFEERWGNLLIENTVSIDELCSKLDNQNTDNNELRALLTQIVFGGNSRLESLKFFLKTLKQQGGDLYISSRGNYSEIKRVLELVKLVDDITGINANGVPNKELVGEKHQFLSRLKMHHGYDKIFYLDDDPSQNQIIVSNRILEGDSYTYFGDNIGLKFEEGGLDSKMMNTVLVKVKSYKKLIPLQVIRQPAKRDACCQQLSRLEGDRCGYRPCHVGMHKPIPGVPARPVDPSIQRPSHPNLGVHPHPCGHPLSGQDQIPITGPPCHGLHCQGPLCQGPPSPFQGAIIPGQGRFIQRPPGCHS